MNPRPSALLFSKYAPAIPPPHQVLGWGELLKVREKGGPQSLYLVLIPRFREVCLERILLYVCGCRGCGGGARGDRLQGKREKWPGWSPEKPPPPCRGSLG